ncbi:MAG: UDP-2,3-diacylglucosamine diphosphatase [Gemmatimonadaceae bacterium]
MSDTHLSAKSRERERDVVTFLKHLTGRAGSLLINGDLFDFWFEWRTVVPRGHYRTLAALAELHDAGVEVLMLAGNHDCWGGSELTDDVGVRYHVGRWTGSVAGWMTEVEHGDGLRVVEDRRYRMLRSVLRHTLSVKAFRLLHPDLGSRLATRVSHTSRSHAARDGGEGLRSAAFQMLRDSPAPELVILGHSHVPALERAPGGAIYANAGSWLEAPTFLLVTPLRIELRRWRESAESDLLHALDRFAEKAPAKP